MCDCDSDEGVKAVNWCSDDQNEKIKFVSFTFSNTGGREKNFLETLRPIDYMYLTILIILVLVVLLG